MSATEQTPCCSPGRISGTQRLSPLPAAEHPAGRVDSALYARFVLLLGGNVVIGDDGPVSYQADGEATVRVRIAPFEIARTCVTNAEFAEFIDATGYITNAERFGWSFVFGPLLPDEFVETSGVVDAEWWRQVYGATWRTPEGPASSVIKRGDHPVVHVSYQDAAAFARWDQSRLCTEAEWEYAARGGTATTWPWGEELEPNGQHRMNVFQGTFPFANSGDDGWFGTCPVDAFEPNQFGILNMLGNVWEWTSDSFVPPARHVTANDADSVLLKGGSFLCHASYCRRYRPGARTGSTPDSTASNVGFRVARSP
jgi:formylglycine-generating enzyme